MTDDMEQRIDAALEQADSDNADGMDPLERRVRLLIPPHAFWNIEEKSAVSRRLPAEIARIIEERMGVDAKDAEVELVSMLPDGTPVPTVKKHFVCWTTPKGIWQLGFAVHRHSPDEPADRYIVAIDAPGIEIKQPSMTIEEAVQLLKVLGIG